MDSNSSQNSNDSSNYWETHYSAFNEYKPSDFAKTFAFKYLDKSTNLIELGCGNGRDALFLVAYCNRYVGLDISETGIKKAHQKLTTEKRNQNFQFVCRDFTNTDFREFMQDRNLFYSRFTLHSITNKQQNNLFFNFLKLPSDKNILVIETRTIYDELYGIGEKKDKDSFLSDHYRRFINPLEFKKFISQDFEIIEWEEGTDLARYREENPYVLRVALKRKSI